MTTGDCDDRALVQALRDGCGNWTKDTEFCGWCVACAAASRLEALATRVEAIEKALTESVGLQSHYAECLNMMDGGQRLTFDTVDAWLERLERLALRTHRFEAGLGQDYCIRCGEAELMHLPPKVTP